MKEIKMIKLKNNCLEINIDPHGAELKSVKDLKQAYEYMWQGKAPHWQRTAPVLFPVIGALKNQQMHYCGKDYTLKKHGFARDMPFQVLEHHEKDLGQDQCPYAVFSLSSNQETLKIYPFDFELIIKYELKERCLSINYEIINKGEKIMWFSIGGHPAFSVNLDSGACELNFEKSENLKSELIDRETGLIQRKFKSLGNDVKSLKLDPSLFDEDALIFSDLKSHVVSLVDNLSNRKVSLSLSAVPKLGVWTDKGPFVCLEPWWGIADYLDASGSFEEKDFNQSLLPYKVFSCGYDLTFE